MTDDRVTLVTGPRRHRRAWIHAMLAGTPDGVTVLRLRTQDSPAMARLALAELLRQARVGGTGPVWLVVEDPVWLARTPLGLHPANRLVAELVHVAAASRDGLRVICSMNPLILKHGDMAGAVMAKATRVVECSRHDVVDKPRPAPAGLAGMLNGFTGRGRLNTAARPVDACSLT